MTYTVVEKLMAAIAIVAACLLVAATAFSGPAAAQSTPDDDTTKLADQIIDCAGLSDRQERLACYDELAGPLMGLEEPEGETTSKALHSFTGKDDWDSEVLEIAEPWRLVWQNQGSALTIELHTEQQEMLDVIGNQIGEGGGRSEVQEPGSYRLAVRGLGGWRIQVVKEADG